ncbi:unnamed protein product [Cyprideis torosa]|uniref:uS12 prolyl 3-hydroxylase n=1 Tax=Cyprideis torosa TaxID=163714 RepID=A0A7R8WAI6_9CRUS|nr:unnamed protein product [Cyprideis torosa]CAG0891027.1 unnamed protein product [Cyprideis torosa]
MWSISNRWESEIGLLTRAFRGKAGGEGELAPLSPPSHASHLPFPCCCLSDFVADPKILQETAKVVRGRVEHGQKDNDLYKFLQSSDLSTADDAAIRSCRNFFLTEVRSFVQSVTGLELSRERVDLTSSLYQHSDYLLCHDDLLDNRRLAFVLYAPEPPEWGDDMGGQLELLGAGPEGEPGGVEVRLSPRFNSLVFFEVSTKSFHRVHEVLSPNAKRHSLNGWFHAATPAPLKPLQAGPKEDESLQKGLKKKEPLQREPKEKEHLQRRPKEEEGIGPSDRPRLEPPEAQTAFVEWVEEEYVLSAETVQAVRRDFEVRSEIQLTGFLNPGNLQRMKEEVKESLAPQSPPLWVPVGPANRRNYDVLSSLPEKSFKVLRSFLAVLDSEIFRNHLMTLTGLELPPRPPQLVLRLLKHGSFSLIRDQDVADLNPCLDLWISLPLGPGGFPEGGGGSVEYIAKDEAEPLLSIPPSEEGTLSLVFRDRETLWFHKYVNVLLKDHSLVWVHASFRVEESGSDASGSDASGTESGEDGVSEDEEADVPPKKPRLASSEEAPSFECSSSKDV